MLPNYHLIYFFLAPELMPIDLNIEFDNVTCISLCWKPPVYTNGRLTSYKVNMADSSQSLARANKLRDSINTY